MPLHRGAVRGQRGYLEAAADLPHEQHARHERQAAGAGHDQRLQRRGPGRVLVVLEADEEIGCDAGQFPEHEQRDEVVGQHDAQHGRHEHEDEQVETRQRRMAVQVAAGVGDDQRPHHRDGQGEQQPQAVQVEGQLQPHGRDPGIGEPEPVPAHHLSHVAQEPERQDCGKDREDETRPPRAQSVQSRRQQGQDETGEDDDEHGKLSGGAVGGHDVQTPCGSYFLTARISSRDGSGVSATSGATLSGQSVSSRISCTVTPG